MSCCSGVYSRVSTRIAYRYRFDYTVVMPTTDDVVTSVRLPRELVDRLDALATEQRRSRSQQLVIVLQRGLDGPTIVVKAQRPPQQQTGLSGLTLHGTRPKEDEAAVAEKIGEGCGHGRIGKGTVAGAAICLDCKAVRGVDGVWR